MQINKQVKESECQSGLTLVSGASEIAYDHRSAGISPDHIRDYVCQLTRMNWGGNCLDIGTGKGEFTQILVDSKKFGQVNSVDLVDVRKLGINHVNFQKCNLSYQRLPFEDDSLDFIFILEVIEHLENQRFCLKELSRVLAKQGKIILTTPNCDNLRSKISFFLRGYFPAFCESDYCGSGHISPLTRLDLKRICLESELRVESYDYSLKGIIPGTRIFWQTLFPFLRGKRLYSDTMIAIITKV